LILYHASNQIVKEPDVFHSRRNLDFGSGFYTTPIHEQALKWCEKFLVRRGTGFISVYELDEKALNECRVLEFTRYSEEWLDFVAQCRLGNDSSDYDLILGGVANDRVFNTCELYFRHFIDKNTALDRLRFESPNHQICFKTQETIMRFLHFEGSEKP